MGITRGTTERGVDVEAGTETTVCGGGGIASGVRGRAAASVIVGFVRFVRIVELRSIGRVDDV